MKRIIHSALLALAFAPLLAQPESAQAQSTQPQSAQDLLAKADAYRIAAQNMQTDVHITTIGPDGAALKERRYLVFSQAGHNALVLMQSPMERGQKVLMLGDDFWLLMPGSARPMRITPMQKLLGEASTGDIATLRWSEDYSAQIVGSEDCGAAPCMHLSLAAKRKAVSYQRIELWIGKTHGEPIRADLYVQSDKLAKQARFGMDRPGTPRTVTEMTLQDQLGSHNETRVRYSNQKERSVPAEWLNPMFLAANPRLDP